MNNGIYKIEKIDNCENNVENVINTTINKKNACDIFGLKKKDEKKQVSYYIESNVDKAFEILASHVDDTSKSELINMALKDWLSSNDGVRKMSKCDDELKRILNNIS